jgi:hypothetical protein
MTPWLLLRLPRSPPRLQLRDHALNLHRLLAGGLGAQILQRAHVLGLDGLLARLHQHPALDPHLHTLGHRQVGAFGDKGRCETGVACAEGFVVERLEEGEREGERSSD